MQTLGLSDSTPKPTSFFKDLFRPDLSNEISAITVCYSASLACFFIAAVTAVMVFFTPAAALIDAGLFALIGLGLRKGMRTAAVAGFILYIIEVGFSMSQGRAPGILNIFISIILFNSMRAAFAYHRFRSSAKLGVQD